MEKEWIVIEISLPGQYVDLAGAVIADLGGGGMLVEDRQLDCFVAPDDELAPERNYRVKTFFETVAEPPQLQRQIEMALRELPVLSDLELEVSAPQVVKQEDWAEGWKQNFPLHKVGSRLVIRPSWEEYQPVGSEVVIEIDPGMAFGTGTHGTTLLCLETIAELLDSADPPKQMLDVGTGSGILALGAAALGCGRVVGNDIDPTACEVARQNVADNGYADRVEISTEPLELLPGTFDLVVANILAEENLRLKNELVSHLRPGGWLVLSGILQEKESMVRDGFAELPLEPFPTRIQGDWVCLLYRCKA